MATTLNYIESYQVRSVWQLIKPGLESMVKQGQNPGNWLAEDIFAALLTDKNFGLWLLSEDGVFDGFMICTRVQEYGSQRLHIWVLHSLTNKNVMATHSEELDEIARKNHCSTTSFGTTRVGWERVAPKFGYNIHEVVYSRPVSIIQGSAVDGQ